VVPAFVALALPSTAAATAPAERFNAPGQGHANVCARLAVVPAALRFPDGRANGFSLEDDFPFEDDHCPFGTVRLDLHELIPSSRGPLAFHRGGLGYDDRANVKYGAVSAYDFADPLPEPIPSSGGRGAACELAQEPAYRVTVRSIPTIMKYKRPEETATGSNSGASLMHYGNPARDQGDRQDVDYSYLVWSFVNVRGGGMVRALLAPGQVVRACDVEPVTMDSYDKDGDVNGTVTARYVRMVAGTCPIYGWMAWSHEWFPAGLGPATHYAPLAGEPPADPAPDPDCPVAAPASAPTVETGAAANRGAEAALAGTVRPHGVPTSYRFELGRDRSYGLVTPIESLGPADRVTPVSTRSGALEPGTTYHYRLAAGSTHGVTYGSDRTFRTAGRAPKAPGVKLSGLRVKPGTFRRGARALIRFKLSAGATVTLTFERRTGRGWKRVRGSLRRTAPGGWTKDLRFRGRVGGRMLARGRYRVRAKAPGSAARARFWLK
jgi:hypothetical protein